MGQTQIKPVNTRPVRSRGKLALVIGVNEYVFMKTLKNAVKHANAMASTLETIGFTVTTLLNPTRGEFENVITKFKQSIRRNSLVLFYFAGHVIQWKGECFLMPRDDLDENFGNVYTMVVSEGTKPNSEVENEDLKTAVKGFMIGLQDLVKEFSDHSPVCSLFLLESCRVNISQHVEQRVWRAPDLYLEQHTPVLPENAGYLIGYACKPKIISLDSGLQIDSVYTKYLLQYITKPDLNIHEVMTAVQKAVLIETNRRQRPQYSCLVSHENDVYLCKDLSGMSVPFYPARWQTDAITVAGGQGQGKGTHQLNQLSGFYIGKDQTMYIADWGNHRVMAWKANSNVGRVIIDGSDKRCHQLKYPTDVIFDQETDTLLICDRAQRRVIRMPHHSPSYGRSKIFINNIDCWGLAMDDQGSLYVSNYQANEVRRYDKHGEIEGILVAGGNGKGSNLNQLNFPTHLFVDNEFTLYVSDSNNHRVMAWRKGSNEGIIVAGGNGYGSSSTQLLCPAGIWVDEEEHVYVVDQNNHRVMRWNRGARYGTVIAGGYGKGTRASQLSSPEDLFFDCHGHLYVTDRNNHRVQRFSLIIE